MKLSSKFKVQSSSRRGFTLIEILIVVGIIGLLASMVLVGLAPAQKRGRDARRIADLKEVQNAMELYYNKCGYYPGPAQPSSPCGSFGAPAADWNALTTALTGSSIGVTTIPQDPSSNRTYYYAADSLGSTYVLEAQLEDVNNAVFNNYNPVLPSGVSITGGCDKTKGYYCVIF